MKNISWREAYDLALKYNELSKVTLFYFIDEDCPVCNGMLELLPEIENEDYQVLVVTDARYMPFTLTSYPMGYVYIPNCPTQMPMQRIGGAPLEVLKIDAERQVMAMKQGKDYYEVRDADRQARGQSAA